MVHFLFSLKSSIHLRHPFKEYLLNMEVPGTGLGTYKEWMTDKSNAFLAPNESSETIFIIIIIIILRTTASTLWHTQIAP